MSAALREFRAQRADQGARMVFVTLTQPKHRGEGPRAAYDRLMRAWRRLREWRDFKALVVGGVRGVEVPYTTPETNPRVEFKGWHAHLHMAWELAPGVNWSVAKRHVLDRWLRIVGGHELGQDFQELDDTNVHQVAKYATKPFELADDLAPKFFRQMAGCRLIDGWGDWRHFRAVARKHEEPGDKWCRGPSFHELGRAATAGETVGFTRKVFVQPSPDELEQYVRGLCDLAKVELAMPREQPRVYKPPEPWPRFTRVKHDQVPAFELDARDCWRALKRDPRPSWEQDRAEGPGERASSTSASNLHAGG